MRRITHRPCILVAFCMFTVVRADWWDDFSNNLATDLSPLLALFGEQVTKQFLSESLSLWDNFIFAMAPLGIVTAVVSAIRVCGGPSLRAFIGRAQEGGGIAEAELCSSTSRDVCELYHNGAIVRVFGRPKILEVVHDADQADFSYGVNDPKRLTPPKCGIDFFKDYVNKSSAKDAGWMEMGSSANLHDGGRPRHGFWNVFRKLLGHHRLGKHNLRGMNQHDTNMFAPNPNLSFNIGIKKYPIYVYWAAAGVGLFSQAAVVVYGAFATYYLQYQKDNALPHVWAFPFMALGTVLLSLGMFWCAFLVERSTQERIFRKQKRTSTKPSSASLYITQPGNQTIADQTYDAFAFSDSLEELKEYITSWKLPRQSDEQRVGVWFATGLTMLGFMFQFIGLRGLHSSVSIVLLAAIVIMSIVRSSLRTGRLKQERNLLFNRTEEVVGHELDWLAMQMGTIRLSEQKKQYGKESKVLWSVVPRSESHTSRDPGLLGSTTDQVSCKNATQCDDVAGTRSSTSIEAIENQSGGIYAFYDSEEHTKSQGSVPSQRAMRLAEAEWLSQMGFATAPQEEPTVHMKPHLAGELFHYRCRLSDFTTPSVVTRSKSSAEWDDRLVPLRDQVRQLKAAIESCARILFPYLKSEWKNATSLAWSLDVVASPNRESSTRGCCFDLNCVGVHQVHIFLRQSSIDTNKNLTAWKVDQGSLEAVLGLWSWSILSNPTTESSDTENCIISGAPQVTKARVLALGADEKEVKSFERTYQDWTKDLPMFMSTKRWESTLAIHEQSADTLWDGSQDVLSSEVPAKLPCDKLLRIFGWAGAAISTSPTERRVVSPHALVTESTQSITSLCAQDIYQRFFSAMATILKTIDGGTRLIEDPSGFHLANDVVVDLVGSVQESGLASRQDAYLMVIPTLSRHSKLTSPTNILPKVYDSARNRRNAGDFKGAESMLRWAWNIGPTTEQWQQNDTLLRFTALELGDLYRTALKGLPEGLLPRSFDTFGSGSYPRQDPPYEPRKELLEAFGRQGIHWLAEKKSATTCPVTVSVIDRYVKLSGLWDKRKPEVDLKAYSALVSLIKGNRDQCLLEITQLSDARASDERNQTLLSWAASRGWLEIVSACLNMADPSVDLEDTSNRTPLSYAAENGHGDVVSILLNSQAIPTTVDEGGRTPLSYASQNGHNSVVKVLMADQRVCTETKDKDGLTPLHWAAAGGHCDTITSLCRGKADVHNINLQGKTPFAVSLENIKEQAAQLLLDFGSSWNIEVNQEEAWRFAFGRGMYSCGNMILRLSSEKSMNGTSRVGRNVSSSLLLQPALTITSLSSSPSPSPSSPREVQLDPLMIDWGNKYSLNLIEVDDDGVQHHATEGTFSRLVNGRLTASFWISTSASGDSIQQSQISVQVESDTWVIEVFWNKFQPDAVSLADLVLKAAQNPFASTPLRVLLEKAGGIIEVTSEIAEATIVPETYPSARKLDLLLNLRKEVDITPIIIQASVQNTSRTGDLVEILLRQRPDDISITESVMKALVGGKSRNHRMLDSIFRERTEQVIITAEVLKAVAANRTDSGEKMLRKLLARAPRDLPLTEEIFEVVLSHESNFFPRSLLLFLRQPNLKINLTPHLLGRILDRIGAHKDYVDGQGEIDKDPYLKEYLDSSNLDVFNTLQEVIDIAAADFAVTDDHLMAAVQSRYCSDEVVIKLLELRKTAIDENVAIELSEVALGAWNGGEVMADLITTHNSSGEVERGISHSMGN